MNFKAFLLTILCFAAVGVVVVAPLLHSASPQTSTVKNNTVANYTAFAHVCHPLGDPIDIPVPK